MRRKLIKYISIIPLLTFAPTLIACGNTTEKEKKDLFPYLELENPTCIIKTVDGKAVTTKTDYIDATFTIKNCADDYKLTDVAGQIRGRGHLSWTWPKKSYSIKFKEKQSVFGSKKKYKKWALISNYGDPAMYRNAVAYTLASKLDKIIFSPSVHMVDVYLNDKYLGMYLFTDRIDDNKGRVGINTEIDPEGNNGYLLEQILQARAEGTENIDYIRLNSQLMFQIKSPDTESAEYLPYAEVQTKYIKDYLWSCIDALNSNDWSSVCNLIDVATFVDGYIIEELFGNLDCYRFSMYYYKDKDGKLCHGPVWDFDLSSGNVNQGPGSKSSYPPDEALWAGKMNAFYIDLLKYSEFKTLVSQRLADFKTSFQEVMELLDPENPDGYYQKSKQSIDRNYTKWKTLGYNSSGVTPINLVNITSFSGQQSFLKHWLERRYDFLEEQFK